MSFIEVTASYIKLSKKNCVIENCVALYLYPRFSDREEANNNICSTFKKTV